MGRVVASATIAAADPEAVLIGLLDHHVARDWGDLDAADKALNDADHSHAQLGLFSSSDTEDTGPSGWLLQLHQIHPDLAKAGDGLNLRRPGREGPRES